VLVVLVGVLLLGPFPVLGSLTSAGAIPTAATPSAAVRLGMLAPHMPAGAERLGRVSPDQRLTITVVLEPSHAGQLSALLRDLYDPTSPRYEEWLPSGQFGREFGPSQVEIDALTSWLHAQGLDDTSVEGLAVRVTGDVQNISRVLGVSLFEYRLAHGGTRYFASTAPRVPRTIAEDISTILGLSNAPHIHSTLDPTPRGRVIVSPLAIPGLTTPPAAPAACVGASDYAKANNYWTADQVGRMYRVDQLFKAGLTGKRTTIALLELGRSKPTDTNNYFSCLRLHNTVKVEHIDGGATADATGTYEADADIQQAATQAPGATIVSYEAPKSDRGEYDAINQIVTDDHAQVVSTSVGDCEAALRAQAGGTAFVDSLHTLFEQAAAQGQSVFAATGDDGSEDCYNGTATPPSETLQVDSPADDPFVTGVGGTSLEGPGIEPVWNNCAGTIGDVCAANGGYAGGGGQSALFKRPTWQLLASDATCSTCRELPDISANAGVGEVFFDSGWTRAAGTSIAAPLLAGIAADIAQSCKGGRLGDLAPKLNALADLHVYGTALTDVTTGFSSQTTGFSRSRRAIETPGNNDLTRTNADDFLTEPGFDLATGFGVPIASGLACSQVRSISPNHGATGTHVTLRGVSLERATIRFGSATAKVLSATTSSAVVIAPAGTGTVDVGGSDPIGIGSSGASFSYPGHDSGRYRTVAADGTVFDFGGAHSYGKPEPNEPKGHVVGMAVDHATGGYWLVTAEGTVYNFHAPSFGSAAGRQLSQPIAAIAATRNGDGYWLVTRYGDVLAFGHARSWGSTAGMHLNMPIVGIAADPRTGGYWLVAADGGVFTFHAPFYGSADAIHLNRPIVGMAVDTASGGYWLVAADGGVFTFHAPFYGSAGAIHLNRPIVGISASDDARGYRFVASDGGVFDFGDAQYSGSTSASHVNRPLLVVAVAQ
jgi:hypothetical protein